MKWRTKARFAAGAFLAAAFVAANPALIGAGPAALPDRHDAAARAAQASAEPFLALALTGRAPGAAVLTEGAGWATPLAWHGGRSLTARSASGEVLDIAVAEIRDWGFTGPDGRLYGHFRARALLPALPPEAAAGLARTLTETPLPRPLPLSADEGDFLLAAGRGSL